VALFVLAWATQAAQQVLPALFFTPFWLAAAGLFAHAARRRR